MRIGPRFVMTLVAVAGIAAVFTVLPDAQASTPPRQQSTGAEPTYVGVTTCAKCHLHLVGEYAQTAHTKKTQPATSQTLVMPADDRVIDIEGKVVFKLAMRGDEVWLTLYNLDGTNPTEYLVERVMGGAGYAGKQRLVILVNQDGLAVPASAADGQKVTRLISPVQYNHKETVRTGDAKFNPYHPEHWYAPDGTLIGSGLARFAPDRVDSSQFVNSWERRCIGCHATGPEVKFDRRTGMFLNESSEFNVWCEACHGPGSLHAVTRNPEHILNPERLKESDPQRALDTCARCHIRGSNVGSGAFSTGYPSKVKNNKVTFPDAGDLLAEWYKRGEGTWGSSNAEWGQYATTTESSKKHHQQGFDYIQSPHWNTPWMDVMCWDCHTPHSQGVEAPQLVARDSDNTLCLQCHSERFDSEDAIVEHTLHSYRPATRGTSRCTGCHMPKTAKSHAWYNDHAGDISSHTFEVVSPELTGAMAAAGGGTDEDGTAIPNGCNACHGDADFGVARWERWKAAGGGRH